MNSTTDRILIWVGTALVIGAALWRAVPREQLIASGEPLLLDLAPVDPRSLIQGDYMALDYAIEQAALTDIEEAVGDDPNAVSSRMFSHDGVLILTVDDNKVGTYSRLGDDSDLTGEGLAPGEIAVRYRMSLGNVEIGQERWFFQEGLANVFEDARFGEFRVDAAGRVILVGMRDQEFERLGEPLARW